MRRSAEDKLCRQLVDQFSIKANGIEQEVGALSGGNQQKVLVAKYILPHISTFLWYDPTRGIDIGAKQEIFELMRKQTSEGKSILFYSTDTSELSNMCDRVIVLSNGKIVATLNQGEINDESILKAAFTVLENADNS
jgi:ribose transport system ATP-binding protein